VTDAGDRRPSWVSRMEQVEWAKLDYAYGKATGVSELIRTIAFGDDAVACKACTTLHEEFVHQASIYSSTYEAIPFLIEALAVTGSGSGARRGVLRLLDDIVDSCVHWMEMEDKADRAPADGEDPYSPFIGRAWLGSELFARLLNDDTDAVVRTYAAHTLGMLLTRGSDLAPEGSSGRYASTVATLIARLQSEADELVLSSVIFALGRASAHDPSLIEHLRTASAKSQVGERIRVAAALAVFLIESGKYANLQEIDLLIDTMCRAADTDGLVLIPSRTGTTGGNPWITGRFAFSLCDCLCNWSAGDHGRMERVLPALLAGIRLTSRYVASIDLGSVFRWLWPDQAAEFSQSIFGEFECVDPPITPKDLTGIARRVLEACYDNPSIWEPNIANTVTAFRSVGLPERRAGLKVLLDEAP
jgi:hypothetical protein